MLGYLDLQAGISGDMFLGCLLDAGWPIDELRRAIECLKLPRDDWAADARAVMKGPLRATWADIRVAQGSAPPPPRGHHAHVHDHERHDHHEHHEHQEHQEHQEHHDHEHHHYDAKGHSHHHDAASHEHRNLDDVSRIIESANGLPRAVRDRAIAVFTRLANAEARVHGTTVDKIHFHEVGALDAIIDIVGSVAGLHALGVTELYASPLPCAPGWTQSAHGLLPLPAPATLELLAAAGAPTCAGPGEGELVTPTGAALVCELARFGRPSMHLRSVAVGAGSRDTPWPNVARLWLGDAPRAGTDATDATGGEIVQIETNLDDMSPQLVAPLLDRLLSAGAVDAWFSPVQMKKGRPAVIVSALAPSNARSTLVDLLMRETSTLGVRISPVDRSIADREMHTVATEYGDVQVKLKRWGGRVIGAAPEYDDCLRLATVRELPVRAVVDAATAAAYARWLRPGAAT